MGWGKIHEQNSFRKLFLRYGLSFGDWPKVTVVRQGVSMRNIDACDKIGLIYRHCEQVTILGFILYRKMLSFQRNDMQRIIHVFVLVDVMPSEMPAVVKKTLLDTFTLRTVAVGRGSTL